MEGINVLLITTFVFGAKCAPGTVTSRSWNGHVISGRHFNALATSGHRPDIARVSTVLLMYMEGCAQTVTDSFTLDTHELPPEKYLLFVKHRVDVVKETVWFDVEDEDDLEARYGVHQCPEALFLNKGSPLTHQIPWIHAEPFKEFLWRLLKVKVRIKNSLDVPVTVTISGNGPKSAPFEISEKSATIIKTYISHIVVVQRTDDNKFLFGKIIQEKTSTGEIIISLNLATIRNFEGKQRRVWLREMRKLEAEEAEVEVRWRTEVAQMFSLTVKQPLVVPKFSWRGFHLAQVEPELRKLISAYRKTRSNELNLDINKINQEPIVNTNEVPVYAVTVPIRDEFARKLSLNLTRVINKWIQATGVKVTLSSLRILKYTNGSVIRPHVNRVDNETIIVTIDIFKGKSAQHKWPLTVFDFRNYIDEIDLTSHHMFIQESTLVTSREVPFRGPKALMLRAGFKLNEAWYWKYTNTHLTDGKVYEPLSTDLKPATKKKYYHRILAKWDKSQSIRHKHDEL